MRILILFYCVIPGCLIIWSKEIFFASKGYLHMSSVLFDSYPGHVHSHFEVLV